MSDYLFAQPSFGIGMGRVLDLGGVFDEYNVSETPEESDARALYADWLAVGLDLQAAMDETETDAGTDERERGEQE